MDRIEQDALYAEARQAHGAAIRRIAFGFEADPDRRRDLVQEMHIELWRSMALYDRRCSLQTWVYRVSHNVAASHIFRRRRDSARLVDLDAIEAEPAQPDEEARANSRYSANEMLLLIRRLKPLDRQIMLLYLEGEAAGEIAEVTGISATNVATKIHRIKKLLSKQLLEGETRGPA